MHQPNNDNSDNDDYIRPPDSVKKERLIGSDNEFDDIQNTQTNYDFNSLSDIDFNQILKQSLEDFELEEDQKIRDMIAKERKEQTEKYVSIRNKLQKIQNYDVANKEMYNTIISIIEMFEMEYLDTYALDETSYKNIFKLLKSIRLTKEEIILLEALIVL
jgi:hypothetical protein